MDDRLTALETKITFQEQIIEELSQLLLEQQQQIDKIEMQYKKVSTQLESFDDSSIVDISLEVPPPHY